VAIDGLYFMTMIKQSIDPHVCRMRHVQTAFANVSSLGRLGAEKHFNAIRAIALALKPKRILPQARTLLIVQVVA